ncbi:MAG: hypothetical protein BWY76_01607 [bacterium ADurb.Bin429]|nr:MAG: hypothetical protein BWY76_01607 [bacterium ADurb.Bin429]
MLAHDIQIGYHPDGFRIDKTATPMNRYTRWTILDDGCWARPRPVCFRALPEDGWVDATHFDWSEREEVM